jgi:hypothetical protein
VCPMVLGVVDTYFQTLLHPSVLNVKCKCLIHFDLVTALGTNIFCRLLITAHSSHLNHANYPDKYA